MRDTQQLLSGYRQVFKQEWDFINEVDEFYDLGELPENLF